MEIIGTLSSLDKIEVLQKDAGLKTEIGQLGNKKWWLNSAGDVYNYVIILECLFL